MRHVERVRFPGAHGAVLCGIIDRPAGAAPRAGALFAHCFACSKDSVAAARISRALAERGVAVLRFDFTGLGESGGEAGASTLGGNIADLRAAAAFLEGQGLAPTLLIGHSLGGAAVLAAAADMPGAQAVALVNAPASGHRLLSLLGDAPARAVAGGAAEIVIGARPFPLTRAFVEELEAWDAGASLARLRAPLFVFHATADATVPISEGLAIFAQASLPKSFLAVDGADHLLTRREDAEYIAAVLGAWAARLAVAQAAAAAPEGQVVVEETAGLAQTVHAGRHLLAADEPLAKGGTDSGPTPYQLLLAALGACTNMTLRLYADRKDWPLAHVSVRLAHRKIHAEDCQDCETREGRVDHIERRITVEGPLDEAQRRRLGEIADMCPVHRTLKSEIDIDTDLAGA